MITFGATQQRSASASQEGVANIHDELQVMSLFQLKLSADSALP